MAGQHRLFTDSQEAEIMEMIISKSVDAARLFTSAAFMAVAMDKWTEFGRDPNEFKYSNKFICAFKERNRFSSRRCHVKRRDPDGDDENIEAWIQNIKDLMAAHRSNDSLDMIVNYDATAWRIIPSGILTWVLVGRDEVLLRLDVKEKDSVTVLTSIAAKGTKLPLWNCERNGEESGEVSTGLGSGARQR
jgi:hypothetical protein